MADYAPPQHLTMDRHGRIFDSDSKELYLSLPNGMYTYVGDVNLTKLLCKMNKAFPDDDKDSLADFCIRWATSIAGQYDYGYDPIEIYKQEKEAKEKMSKKDIANNAECGAKMVEEMNEKMNEKSEHFTNGWYPLQLPRTSFAEKVGFRVMRPYNNESASPYSGMFNNTMETIEKAAKEHHILDAVKIQDMPYDSVCCGLFGTLIVDVMYTKIGGDKLLQFMELRHDLSTRDWGPVAALVSLVMYKRD